MKAPETHVAAQEQVRILGISGSLRKASFSTAILRALARRTSASMSFDVMTLEEIPFYNEDLDCPPGPPAVENMKTLIAESDGVLIATPEDNDGIPDVLQNALDWASRPAFQSCFKNKPVSIISSSLAYQLLAESPVRNVTQSPASGRFTGGVRALHKLREALIAMQAHLVMGPEVVIGGVHGEVDHSEYYDEGGLPFILQSLEKAARGNPLEACIWW